jgi:hypothetical protein
VEVSSSAHLSDTHRELQYLRRKALSLGTLPQKRNAEKKK